MRNPENKTSLVKFLIQQWKESANREKLHEKSLYVTCGEDCYIITKNHWDEIQGLKSTQEEADTRLLFHASWHAAEDRYRSIVITSSEDTSVLILCVCLSRKLACSLYQKTGTQNRTRYINICKLVSSLGEDVCQVLVGPYAFTGCDTVSAFAGHGKLGALKLLEESETYKKAFKHLGEGLNVSTNLFGKLQEFVCRMYASTFTICDVNELHHLFCSKRSEVDSSQLSPCKEAAL